jgi:RNA polymerase sigma-70 factor (ECF subfamily)
MPDVESAGEPSPAEDRIYLTQVLEHLGELGEGMKEAALLVHAEGMSHAEAGEVLGVSESTISWRLHTIRKHMSKSDARLSGNS